MTIGMTRVTVTVALLITAVPVTADHLDVKVAPDMREYCHIVKLPRGWKVPPGPGLDYLGYADQYEFRVSGLAGGRFLVAGVDSVYKRYTINKYEVDLSDAKAPVVSATDQAWESASRASTAQKSAAVRGWERRDQPMEYRGVRFAKSGEFWSYEGGRLSPDQAWLVLQSWTGSASSGGETGWGGCFPFACRGKIFFDIFSVDTSKKLLTIEGTYSGNDPEGTLLGGTEWLTERYFIVPMGEHRERSLVCEFGERRPGRMKP